MQYDFSQQALNQLESDCLLITSFNDNMLSHEATMLDKATNQALSKQLQLTDFTGDKGQTQLLLHLPGCQSPRVLVVGLGDKNTFDRMTFCKAMKAAFNVVINQPIKHLTLALESVTDLPLHWIFRQIPLLVEDAYYQFTAYKAKPKPRYLTDICFIANKVQGNEDALTEGQAIAEGMRFSRNLANQPANVCNPKYIVDYAEQLAKQFKLAIEVLDVSAMKKLNMGALLGVGQGSQNPPYLISLSYKGSDKDEAPYVFVGKGITFDSGGISIKPADHMEEMKYDMCGAATVLGVLHTVAALSLPINVVGIIPTAENMPGGNSYRPGDILTTMSGQTVEIINTDAEGRLILSDALTYAERFKPKVVIDIATLTGAIVVSLGPDYSGIFANDDKLAHALVKAGDDMVDRAWHMPLVQEYKELFKSEAADMSNCGPRWGGAITAALFLDNFAKKYTWAHIDMAAVMTKADGAKDASGRPIPLLVNYLLQAIKA